MEAKSIFDDSVYGDNRKLKSDDSIRKLIASQLNSRAQRAFDLALDDMGCSPRMEGGDINCPSFNIYRNEIGVDGDFCVGFSITTTSKYFTVKAKVFHVDQILERNFLAWEIEEPFDLARILQKELRGNRQAMRWYGDENKESKNAIAKFLKKILPVISENAFQTFKESVIDKKC